MSLVHKHYHFKYYYCLLLQWLYISMALFLGCCIFVAIEFALLIPYLFVVFKSWFTWLQTGSFKIKSKALFSVYFLLFMVLLTGAKQIGPPQKKTQAHNFQFFEKRFNMWLCSRDELHLCKTKKCQLLFYLFFASLFLSRLKDPV